MQKINFDNLFNEMLCTDNIAYMSNYHSEWIWDKILQYNGKIYAIINDLVVYNKLKIKYDNDDTHLSYQTLCLNSELKLGNIDGLGIAPGFYNRFKDKLPESISLNSWTIEIKNKIKDIFWLDIYIDFDNYHILTELIDNKELFEQIPYITIYIYPLLLEAMELKKINNTLKNIYISN